MPNLVHDGCSLRDSVAFALRLRSRTKSPLDLQSFKMGLQMTEKCESPEVPLWERIHFVSRSTASRHLSAQRAAKKQPPARRGANLEQSFWKPVDVIALFKQEALRALQEEHAAGHTHILTRTPR